MNANERAVEKTLTKSVLAKITMTCEKQKECGVCPLRERDHDDTSCLIFSHIPADWNLEKIAEAVADAEI